MVHKKLAIGSIHSKLNFKKSEKAFIVEISDEKKKRLDEVKSMLQSRKLINPRDPAYQKSFNQSNKVKRTQHRKDEFARSQVKPVNRPKNLLKSWNPHVIDQHFRETDRTYDCYEDRDFSIFNRKRVDKAKESGKPEWDTSNLIKKPHISMFREPPKVKSKKIKIRSKHPTLIERERLRNQEKRERKVHDRRFARFQNEQDEVRRNFEDLEFSQNSTSDLRSKKPSPLNSEILRTSFFQTSTFDNSLFKTHLTTDEDKPLSEKYTAEMLHNDNLNEEKEYIPHNLLFYRTTKEKKEISTREVLRRHERKKTDFVRLYFHDGAFKFSEEFETKIWSCCLHEHKNSQGCKYKTENVMKWNTGSF